MERWNITSKSRPSLLENLIIWKAIEIFRCGNFLTASSRIQFYFSLLSGSGNAMTMIIILSVSRHILFNLFLPSLASKLEFLYFMKHKLYRQHNKYLCQIVFLEIHDNPIKHNKQSSNLGESTNRMLSILSYKLNLNIF